MLFCPWEDLENGKYGFHKRTWSLLEGTTVDVEVGILVEEGVEEPRRAELATWTTLVTVMVCLILFVADCLVTAAPSDGNWFSWFKTNVVVDGWGLCCWRHSAERRVVFKFTPTTGKKKHQLQHNSVSAMFYNLTLIVTIGAWAGGSDRTTSIDSLPTPTSRALMEIDWKKTRNPNINT